jgi:hypothetical protein
LGVPRFHEFHDAKKGSALLIVGHGSTVNPDSSAHWRAANFSVADFSTSSSQRLYQEYPLGRFTTAIRAETFSGR